MTKYMNFQWTSYINCILIATIVIVNLVGVRCHDNGGTGDTGCSPGGDMNNNVRYLVNVQKTSQTVAASTEFWYMYYQVAPNAPVTYYREVTEDFPLIVDEFYMTVEDKELYAESNMVNVCEDYPEGSMEANIKTIIEIAFMNGGTCPIAQGTVYQMPATMPGVTLIFNERIPCGQYTLILNLSNRNEWVGQMEFQWELVAENDDCIES